MLDAEKEHALEHCLMHETEENVRKQDFNKKK